MTLKGFFFLFAVTMVSVAAAVFIAERVFAPGFERGILIAVLAGLVVFPAARWAETRGWVRGHWRPGRPDETAPNRGERSDASRDDRPVAATPPPGDAR